MPTDLPTRILVLGASGQLGAELVPELMARYGADQVIATDLAPPKHDCLCLALDVMDRNALQMVMVQHKVQTVFHLAALLSATGEQNPVLAWNVNMNGLRNVLDACVEHKVTRVFWPSSIAAFGPNTPMVLTPQYCVMDPTSMYGITKLSGELLCQYYYNRYGLDVRSLRYPGLISYTAPPGGGTTDYAVEIFHEALKHGRYTCFLGKDTALPMLYMPDAVRGTLQLMCAPSEDIRIRTSYNLAGFSFTPGKLVELIQKHLPKLQVSYVPDYRQAIADSWPRSIDDAHARADWGWRPKYKLDDMVASMIENLAPKY